MCSPEQDVRCSSFKKVTRQEALAVDLPFEPLGIDGLLPSGLAS